MWMAISFWRSGISAEKVTAKRAQGGWASFAAGLLVTIGNPKTMIFYLALLPTFIDLRAVTGTDLAMLIAVTAIVLIVVLTPYVAAAGRARAFLHSPSRLRLLNRFAAFCLGGAAAAIAVRAA
jgi:threonine/homoserine/homoserine lactone efflux protein